MVTRLPTQIEPLYNHHLVWMISKFALPDFVPKLENQRACNKSLRFMVNPIFLGGFSASSKEAEVHVAGAT